MKEAVMREVTSRFAMVFETLCGPRPNELSKVKRRSKQTFGPRGTNGSNVELRMLRREDIREQHAKLTAAGAAEKWVGGFVMALWLMAVIAMRGVGYGVALHVVRHEDFAEHHRPARHYTARQERDPAVRTEVAAGRN